MKKIVTIALLTSMALAACSNGEEKPETSSIPKIEKEQSSETTKTTSSSKLDETDKANSTSSTNETDVTTTTKVEENEQTETLSITQEEVHVFLKTIPFIDDYTYTVEDGRDAFSAMLTSDKDRKTVEIAKNSSYFKGISTEGVESLLATSLPIELVKAQRVLTETIKEKDSKLTIELVNVEGNKGHFEVFELVNKGEKTEHRNRYDTVVYDAQKKTFKSEENKNDYSSLYVE